MYFCTHETSARDSGLMSPRPSGVFAQECSRETRTHVCYVHSVIPLLSLSFPQVLPCSILIGYGRFVEEALPFDAAAQFAPSSCMVRQCSGIHSIPFVRAPLRLSAVSFAMPSTLSAERLCCLCSMRSFDVTPSVLTLLQSLRRFTLISFSACNTF